MTKCSIVLSSSSISSISFPHRGKIEGGCLYLRPMKPFLTGQWQNLIMFNYAADPVLLQQHLPRGTELDEWDGIHYISLVGFMFLNTKLRGVRVPFMANFEECNLRFYVRVKENNEWKRGVVFVKEIVPKRLISAVANSVYGEHYCCYPMRHSVTTLGGLVEVQYEWLFKSEWNTMQVTAQQNATPLQQGSEAEFITEHYWGYTKLKSGFTSEYKVEHPRWDIHEVVSHNLHCNTNALYGDAFAHYLNQKPVSVFMAKGSAVKVYPRKLWKL